MMMMPLFAAAESAVITLPPCSVSSDRVPELDHPHPGMFLSSMHVPYRQDRDGTEWCKWL